MATHNLSDEEYGDLICKREEALRRCSELEAKLEAAKSEDPEGRIRPLNALCRELIKILRFAVANLNPENTRGWPVETLRAIAMHLTTGTLPDAGIDDVTFAAELLAFSNDCEEYALARVRMREEKLKADAAAPKGDLDRPKEEQPATPTTARGYQS